MLYVQLPFRRGESQTEGFDHLLGREYEVEDIEFTSSQSTKSNRTGKIVRLMLVKNSSGISLLPRRLVKFKGGSSYRREVDGYANVSAEEVAGVVDEFLPSTGVPTGSFFYIVVSGPTTVVTPDAGSAFNGDISIGSVLVAATAAASTGVTAGRVAVQNITASSATSDYSSIMNNVQNRVARAMSAATTGQTATAILCDVKLL